MTRDALLVLPAGSLLEGWRCVAIFHKGNAIKEQWWTEQSHKSRSAPLQYTSEMWRTAFSLSTFITAAAAVVVLVGGAAGLNTSQFTSDLTKEITMSLVVNQLAILKSINESSSGCASRELPFRVADPYGAS